MTIPPRRALILACLFVPALAMGQEPSAERAAKLAERYEAMLAANPVEGIALDRLWKGAQDQGTTADLIAHYKSLAAAQPPSLASLLVYGHLLRRAGHLDEAAGVLRQAAAADPSSPLPPLALADLAFARGQPAEAAGLCETALKLLPADDRRRTDVLLKAGDDWMAAAKPIDAARCWEGIVALDPTNLSLHKRLAQNYEQNGLPDRALAHYEYLDKNGSPPERADALRALARLHEARGEFDAARDALESGLSLTARGNWLHGQLEASLIQLYQRAGRADELEARWKAEAEKAPRDLGVYLQLEALAEAQADPETQRQWLEKIVALAPRDRENTVKLARVLADAGERERAAALYDGLLADQPGNLDLLFARAELDLQLGRNQAAVDRIEAAVATNPADDSVTAPALQFFLSHRLDDAAAKRLQADAARQPDADEPALALARFYFARRQQADGRAVLEALTHRPGSAKERAARLAAAADCYKDQNLPDDAVRCWREAGDLDPGQAAPLVAMAEELARRQQVDAAQAALASAINATPPGPARIEIEHKLFGILDAASPPAPPPALEGGGPSFRHPGFGIESPAAPPKRDQPLGRYLAGLEAAAAKQPSADAWLHLARWEDWARQPKDAANYALRAIGLDAGNLAARELLITVAGETHQRDVAEARLQELITLDPAGAPGYRRRIASLKMDDGAFDEAIALLSALQQNSPGSVAALTDLALAQQRADRWYDALATWERAYALPAISAAERTDVRRPMLLILDRLGQYDKGANVLLAAVDSETDPASKQDRFRELTDFCQKHDLAGWLEKQYETRHAAQPQEYFSLTALASLRQAAGDERAAYQLLGQAYYCAPDRAQALRALVDLAESLGETSGAITDQRRLLALPGQATPENYERLAHLEEDNLAAEDAAKTWGLALAKFPRETDVIQHAADFFEHNGMPARTRELLAELTALDPTDFPRLLHLGQLDAQAGDSAGAAACFEEILARTAPESPGAPLVAPEEWKTNATGPSREMSAIARFRTRGFATTPEPAPMEMPSGAGSGAGTEDARQRLEAIRERSRLFAAAKTPAPGDDAARAHWIERWQAALAAGARTEPLWAFFYTGEKGLTLDLLANALAAPKAGEAERNAFLIAGLRLEAYDRLAQWAWTAKDPDRGAQLIDALIRFLGSGGKPGPGMVAKMFPADAGNRDLLWRAASEGFAAREWLAQAAELGDRVLALAPFPDANYGLQIAHWNLLLGNITRARSILLSFVDQSAGDTFESTSNPVFEVLREYFLLLPAGERRGFAEDYLAKARGQPGPAHAVLAAILLHGLEGDEETARQDIDALLALRMLGGDTGAGSPASRRWLYLLGNGLQLQEWGLDTLAAALWGGGLRQENAFDQQDADGRATVSDLRMRLLALQMALAADPQRSRELLDEYLRAKPSLENVAMLATQLEVNMHRSAPPALYEYQCEAQPSDGDHWRNLMAAYEAEGNTPAVERVLDILLDGGQPLPNGLMAVDLCVHRAQILQAGGEGALARRQLERERLGHAPYLPLLMQLAASYDQAGDPERASAVWKEALPLDVNFGAHLNLAASLAKRGNIDEAISVLRQADNGAAPAAMEPAVAGRLAELYLGAGRQEDLRALTAGELRAGEFNSLRRIAASMQTHGQTGAARELLAAAARRAKDPQTRFEMQVAIVISYQFAKDSGDEAGRQRELRRLEAFAGDVPERRNHFVLILSQMAQQHGTDAWIEDELWRAWHAGDAAAAEELVRLFLQSDRADELRKIVQEVDHHPDLPETWLAAIESALVSSKYAAAGLPLGERLAKRFPQNLGYALARARLYWQSGDKDKGRNLLEAIDATSVFLPEARQQIVFACPSLDGGEAEERQYLEERAAADPLAMRTPETFIRLAHLDVQEKRFEEARQHLRTAYRNPSCSDLQPLLGYLTQSAPAGADAGIRMPGSDFPLSRVRRAQLLLLLCQYLEQNRELKDADKLALAHPEFWEDVPALADRLREHAAPEELPALAAALEDAVSQAPAPVGRLARILAAVDAQRAEIELKTPSTAADGLTHLARAHELAPDDFAIAESLARVYLDHKQRARAAEALKDFLADNAFPEERERSRALLGTK